MIVAVDDVVGYSSMVEHKTDRIFSILANSAFDQPVLNLCAGIAFSQTEMPMEALKQVGSATDINNKPDVVCQMVRHLTTPIL